jgi:hypothetical protein
MTHEQKYLRQHRDYWKMQGDLHFASHQWESDVNLHKVTSLPELPSSVSPGQSTKTYPTSKYFVFNFLELFLFPVLASLYIHYKYNTVRHSVINHCDRHITHLGDLDISFKYTFCIFKISFTFRVLFTITQKAYQNK